MLETIKTVWSDLDVKKPVNQRELVLGMACCTLAGMVLGMLVSPRKNMTLGSHNGCNNAITKPLTDGEETEE